MIDNFMKKTFLNSKWMDLIILISYIFLMLYRVPELILRGRMWAEEATIYFAPAYINRWYEALFTPHLGYFSLFNNFAAILAATIVPLEYSAILLVSLAAVIQTIPLVLAFQCKEGVLSTLQGRLALCGALLFILPNHEVWLNTVNSTDYLAICAGIILISHPSTRSATITRWVIIALGGLTGIFTVILTPFFWFRVWLEKSKYRIVEASILTFSTIIQIIIIFKTALDKRDIALHFTAYLHAQLIKLFVYPLTGLELSQTLAIDFYNKLATDQSLLLTSLLAIFLIVALGFIIYKSKVIEAQLLYAAALFMGLLCWVGALESSSLETHALLILPIGSERYFICSSVFIYLALAFIALNQTALSKAFRIVLAGVVLWAFVIGALDYTRSGDIEYSFFFKGADWQEQVKNYQANPTHPIVVWPNGWKPLLLRE
jgi:hypothetical protein